MKFKVLTILIMFALFGYVNAQNTEKSLSPNDKLVENIFFDKMKLSLPSSLQRVGDKDAQKASEMLGFATFESTEQTTKVTIRKKKGEGARLGLDLVKMLSESMAKSYKGEIHTSEIKYINDREVYIFEMTGFWNDSEIKESWIKFFTISNNDLYQCLIRYPEGERKETTELRKDIVNSLAIIK